MPLNTWNIWAVADEAPQHTQHTQLHCSSCSCVQRSQYVRHYVRAKVWHDAVHSWQCGLTSLELEDQHADTEEQNDPYYRGDVSVVHVGLYDGPPSWQHWAQRCGCHGQGQTKANVAQDTRHALYRPDHTCTHGIRLDVLIAVSTEVTVFWRMALCNLVDMYWHFGATCCRNFRVFLEDGI